MIKVAVLGSAGRMGKALIKGIADSKSLALCAAIDKPGLKLIGEDSGLVSGIEANGILVCDSFSSASIQNFRVASFFNSHGLYHSF